ncbi:hypothetical protein BDZ94DRAFT_1026281 [Collybia nuda]|uniref:BTB/POZ domain-containing protein n=1 Tax=Collybia nuda TaxID=64659 RepID=A0A9P6CMG7_9AGAR|nr:hypothetical protein BDZ94DRAFT_1026281 [Collybia nuda]
MQKLNEEWTPHCVASYFSIDHKAGRPIGCNSRTDYVYSRTCGMGWRFALRYDDEVNPPEVEVYFDPNATDGELKNIRVATRHFDEGTISTKARDFEILPKGREMISCWQIEDVINNPQISFVVIFPPINFTPEAVDQAISHKVLAKSMTTGSFVDMQFFAVSRRLSSRAVGGPKSTFANSTLLTQNGRPSILDKYVVGSPIESTFIMLGRDVAFPEHIDIGDYGYESDSDLDDPEDLPDESESLSNTSLNMYTDGSIEEPPNKEQGRHNKHAFDAHASSITLETAQIQTTIFLKDTAHATWQALVYHAYTGEIVFSRLRSESMNMIVDDGGIRCSPKSMYRLADKLGLDDLKKEAFKALTERVTEDNVLEEVFSRFTSRSPRNRFSNCLV